MKRPAWHRRRKALAPTLVMLALGLAASACGGSSATKTVTVDRATTIVTTVPAATAAPATTAARPLAASARRPRLDGFWRVAYIPLRTNDAQGTIRRYWQVLPLCKRGACSFRVLSRLTPHGSVSTRFLFKYDSAIGDYRFIDHAAVDCVIRATGRVSVKGGYKYVRQIHLSVATARLRGQERIATRAGGRDVFSYTETPAAATENCTYAAPEQYRVVMVRLGSKV